MTIPRPARVLALLAGAAAGLALPHAITPTAASAAAGSVPTSLAITATSPVPAGASTTITVTLRDADGTPGDPVAGDVEIHRVLDGAATVVATVRTDGAGTATHQAQVLADPADNEFFAVFPGDEQHAGSTSERVQVAIAPSAQPTTLTLRAPSSAKARSRIGLTATLTAGGAPVTGATVAFQRRIDGTWTDHRTAATDPAGVATTRVNLVVSTRFRAVFRGTPELGASRSAVALVRAIKRAGRVTIDGPDSLVDERTARLTIRFRTASGDPVNGEVRVLARPRGAERFRRLATVRTRRGVATLEVRPRVDTAYKAVGRGGVWHTGDTSRVHRIDNLPPGDVVRLPAGAPRPRITLPPQQRAVGNGPNPSVTGIPDGVWRSMRGRSWRPGCLARSSLSLIRINYWGYDGYRHRGELVVARAVAGRVAAAFADLYREQIPIRAMYRVDRFGYSPRLHGADDYKSMAAGNTSAFNCRWVVGRPGVRSPHASGRSIDINPWENPYHSPQDGWVPNRWWVGKHLPPVTNRSSNAPTVRTLRRHGIRWTYGTRDAHHFDA